MSALYRLTLVSADDLDAVREQCDVDGSDPCAAFVKGAICEELVTYEQACEAIAWAEANGATVEMDTDEAEALPL